MRPRLAGAACALALAAVALLSVRCGPGDVGWESIARVALVETGLRSEAEAEVPASVRAIVWHVRVPRLLVAGLVGASLSLSGALLQGLLRNPLASPGVIGVSSGAALGAAGSMSLGLAAVSAWAVPVTAFAGGLAAARVVYRVASRGGRTSIATVLLCGIAVNSIAGSLTSAVLSLSAHEWEVGRRILFWLMGGLENRSWEHVLMVAPVLALCTAAAACVPRELNLLAAGEESALALGVDAARVKRRILAVAAAAAGSAVSVAGVIGFVGLVVPHVTRLIVGPDHRRLLPASLAAGALFLTGTDLVARLLPAGVELRAGVLTSALGGPFFLYLVIQHRRRSDPF